MTESNDARVIISTTVSPAILFPHTTASPHPSFLHTYNNFRQKSKIQFCLIADPLASLIAAIFDPQHKNAADSQAQACGQQNTDIPPTFPS
jgi:hypothetical protein